MTTAEARHIDVRSGVATSIWPTPAQLQLLRAALWSGPDATAAWTEWQRIENLRELDYSSWCLLPLVWRNLTSQGVREDEVLAECRGYYRYHWARSQQQLRQAAGWVADWQARGVPVLVLKGAALAAGTYGDAGVRPMSDVDLLVPLAQVRTVAGWLRAGGWQAQAHYLACEEVAPEAEPAFNWQRGTEQLDLHWHVLHRCTRPEVTQQFWDRARPLQLGGVATRQLAAEDMLLHLCSHGMQFSTQPPFRWLADVAWILRRAEGSGFDWTRVAEMAGRTGATLALQHGLAYGAEELRLPVPGEVLARWRARRVSRRERWDYARLIRPDGGGRWIRAWHLARLTWRIGGSGPLPSRWRRMHRFLCARWESPTLGRAVALAVRKALTGHRGTELRRMEEAP